MNHQSNAVGHILRKVSGATISYEDMKTLSLDTARTIQAKAHRCVEVLNALETVMMLDAITNEPKQCDPAFVKVYSARLSEIQDDLEIALLAVSAFKDAIAKDAIA